MAYRELIILGAGPAGLTAAIYAKRAGLDTLIIDRGTPGGQITNTSEVDNWPGTISTSGFDLGDAMYNHALRFEADYVTTEINKIDRNNNKIIIDTSKEKYETSALIIATGSTFKPLGCKGESEYVGRGVSYCAVCDGAFYRNQEIVVVGGGNTAVEEAIYLTKFVSKVYLVHRRNELRADQLASKRLLANPKVVPVWDSVVEEIVGDSSKVNSVKIKNVKTGEYKSIDVTGVFIFVGIVPNVDFVGDIIKRDEHGWIIVNNERMETSVPGIYAAGDVRTTELRQLVTAASDGARAAISAYKYIELLRCRSEGLI